MEIVDITDKFMLEVMFIKLQLPPPQFFCCKVGERFAVTIKFLPSTQHQRRDDEAMALSGYSYNSIEDAMDVAAARVIKYMETMRAKVLKDYSYNELQQAMERELHLIGLLKDKEKEIKELVLKIRELSKGFADYLYQVKSTSSEIHHTAKESVCSANSISGGEPGKAAIDIHNAIAHLNQLSDNSMQLIQNTGVYPLRRGSTSTAYVPSEDADTTSYNSLL